MEYIDLTVGMMMIVYLFVKGKLISSGKTVINTENNLDKNYVIVLLALAAANSIPLLSRAMEKIF